MVGQKEIEPVTYVATIEAPASSAATIAAGLEEDPTALAVMLFECGNHRVEVSAHYAEAPDRERLTRMIHSVAGENGLGGLRIEPLPPKNWVMEAEKLRRPVRAGRFPVHGRHDRGKVPPRRFTLEIDAGLAFGTAHHATTRGCLLALDRLAKRACPRHVVDIGTGTGILAIAAAKALNANIVASDLDPVAVKVARENARENRVAQRVRVVQAAGLDHPELRRVRAGLLFANILLRPLLDLAPPIAKVLRPGGACVLSGILDGQASRVEARFRSLGFTLDWRIRLDGWSTLVLCRRRMRKTAAD
jgi:ribosomal protein L11 methyltransferase